MQTSKFKIIDPVGIHARPASVLATTANEFKSEAILKVRGKTANIKSIMNLMSLGVQNGDEVELKVSGSDEKKAMEHILKSFKDTKLI